MNWKRIGRSLVCLLVAAVLLFNISPLGVKATGLEVLITYAGAGLVLTVVLLGLGVGIDKMTSMPDGTSLISALTDYVAANYSGMTEDGKLRLYNTSFSANPDSLYYVDSQLVELVRNWLWDNGLLYLTSEKVYGSGFSIDGDKTAGKAYWADFSLFNTFAGVSSGFLLVSANKTSLADVTFWGGITVDSTSFDVPVLRVASVESIVPYTSADYPVGTLVNGIALYKRSSEYICRNFEEALSFYSVSGKEYYFLSEDTYIKSFNSGSLGSGKYAYYTFGKLGKIATNGSVSYSDFYIYAHSSTANYTDTYPLLPQYSLEDAVGSDLDIITGHVAPPAESLEAGYEDWFINAMEFLADDSPTAQAVLGLPIVMDEEATQQDVWRGTLEDVLEDTIPAGSVANTPWETFTGAMTDFIVTPIIDGIKAIFVPSSDFLTAKIDIIRNEFGFGEAIVRLAQTLVYGFSDYGREPPVIYINLQDSRTDYELGTKVAFIDMHWYEEYKPTVDALLSSFLWLFFLWKMFKQLPGIISGMPGDFVVQQISGSRNNDSG